MDFNVNYLNPSSIEQRVQDFLAQYHPAILLPVPIEKIIEFQLDMDIIPLPGLQTTAKQVGLDIDAFYSHIDNSITIDEFVWKKREKRYRFSLAHEIGHKVLHNYVYNSIKYSFIDEYLDFINNIPANMQSRAEWQANEFAGRVLMPTQVLKDEFDKAVESIEKETMLSFSVDPTDVVKYAIQYYLAEVFNTSEDAVRIRLETEGLIDKEILEEDIPF